MDRLVTLSKIVGTLGPIKGEKSLQKMIYLAEQYGERLGYNFTWNNYGPISFNLQRDIQELAMLGLISIKQDGDVPVYTKSSRITELSPFWKEKLQNTKLSSGFEKVINYFQSIGDKSRDPLFLEMLASLDYMNRHNMDEGQLGLQYTRCSEDILTSAQQSLEDLQVYQ